MIEKSRVSPPVNIIESGDVFYIEVYIPGVCEDDIEVIAGDGEIIISGNKRETYPYEEERIYHRLEREYGHFRIALKLPSSFNKSEAKAVLENGVLKLSVPKVDEKRKKFVKVPILRK